MSARTGRFGAFGSSSGRGKAAGAVIACAVMLLAGCGGSGGSTADAGAPVIRGDVAGTSSVTAVAGVGQVVVSWPESQTSSTQKVTGYEVQVSTDSGGTWAGAGTGCAKDTTTKSTALTCTATGLAAGTYSFRIATLKKNPKTKATKTTDFSAGSTGAPVIAAPGTPAKPTVVAGDSKVTVTVAAGTGGTPTSYTVTAYTAAGVVAGTACTVPGASGDCDVTGLTNGTPYTVKATATIGDSTSPVPAVSDSFTPLPKPGTPTVSAVAGDGKVTATMNAGTGGTPASYTVTANTTTGVVAGTCTVTLAPWSCDVTGLTNGTQYTVTATATNTTGTSGASPESAPVSMTLAIGSTGPGGGKVFYVSTAGFTSTGSACGTSCHYLEAQTTDLGQAIWCDDQRFLTQDIRIGTGFANTKTMADKGCAAALAAQGASGGGLSDWFLPSREELVALNRNAGSAGVKLPTDADEWSSSAVRTDFAHVVDSSRAAFSSGLRGSSYRIRAVRAF